MKQSGPSFWKSNLLLLVSSIVFICVILEIAIRTYDALRGFGFFPEHRNIVAKTFKSPSPFRKFGFDLYESQDGVRYISSRYGELYPIKKPKGSFRVVVLGGSSSENSYSFDRAGVHYPLLVQSQLRSRLNRKNIEIINVANSAYSTAHSLILFELDVLSWNPDLIIVSHNINDLLTSYWPNFAFDYSNKYSTEFYGAPKPNSVYTIPNIIFQHSALYWVIRSRLKRILTRRNGNSLQRTSYGYELPPLGLQVFERNLRSIIALAKANNIQVILGNQSLQPSEEFFVKHMEHKPYNSIVVYPLHEEFVRHHISFNKKIERVAKETQVLFIDNDSVLGGERKYFIDFVHYTPEGVQKLAENYTNFIIKNDIVH